MRTKHFTNEQIEKYSKDSRVKYIDENKMILTYEFRLKLWFETLPNHSTSDVRHALINNHFEVKGIYCNWFFKLSENFKLRKPCGAKNETFCTLLPTSNADKTYDNYLLSTGKFIKSRKGIKFTAEFIQEIYTIYPKTSIENYLTICGFDINRIGY